MTLLFNEDDNPLKISKTLLEKKNQASGMGLFVAVRRKCDSHFQGVKVRA